MRLSSTPGRTSLSPPAAATLAGSVTDDGCPRQHGDAHLVGGSGPRAVDFDYPHGRVDRAHFEGAGTFRAAADGQRWLAVRKDTMTVTVTGSNASVTRPRSPS